MSIERERLARLSRSFDIDHIPPTQPLLSRLQRVQPSPPTLGDALESMRLGAVIKDLSEVLVPPPPHAAGAALGHQPATLSMPADPAAIRLEIERLAPTDGPYPGTDELRPIMAAMAPAAPFDQYDFVELDEERMPIPSTWREGPQDQKAPWLPRQIMSGLMGLAGGLAVVVPATFWLLGHFDAPPPRKVAAMAEPIVLAVRPQSIVPEARAADVMMPVASEPLNTLTTPAGDPTVLLASVELLVAGGEVGMARALLLQSELRGHPAVMFALAETFDPNMLAAWSVTGVNAEPAKARELYSKALDSGIERAKARLDALK
jgi:hypothetical protein